MKSNKTKGFTLIELLIVVAVIAILAAIAIPYYVGFYLTKSKLSEVTNSMSYLASSLGNYRQDQSEWPPNNLNTFQAVQNTLGVTLPQNRISAVAVNGAGAGNPGQITLTVQNIHNSVDTLTLTLTPNIGADGAITWTWGGSVPIPYIPRNF